MRPRRDKVETNERREVKALYTCLVYSVPCGRIYKPWLFAKRDASNYCLTYCEALLAVAAGGSVVSLLNIPQREGLGSISGYLSEKET